MQEITLESIYNLLEKVDVRIETAEQNISLLMNSKEQKSTVFPVAQAPITPPVKNGVMVNYNGNDYRFNVPQFKMPGELIVHKSENAANDPEIIERILRIEGQCLMSIIY